MLSHVTPLSSSEAYWCRPLSISYFDHKLLVASIRFSPADIDNPLSPIGVSVKRLAIDRVPFELVGNHALEHGRKNGLFISYQ